MDNNVASPGGDVVRLGVSSCLLGHAVRYDGHHKADAYILGTLARVFELVPFCPEVAAGLGVPRPPVRLSGDPSAPRARGVDDPGLDVTAALRQYGRDTARRLGDINGFIFKSRSPSCGMAGVKLYPDCGPPRPRGVGLFAREIMAARPLLPVEEEERLGDPLLRENFIERVFAHRRWQALLAGRLSAARLLDFHAVHKLALMAHGPGCFRELGRLLAGAGRQPVRTVAADYGVRFMAALTHRATRKRHTKVLRHILGCFKKKLDRDDVAELLEVIDAYRLGELPLLVPVALFRHHLRRHHHPYLARQTYLNPEPRELMWRGLA
ncbi:MAG TPA: DUF1722 domain-containing protein [Gammaproteobacteria bacterium]|nr:DUF1722 domain-containing protein [Gammaproteobacteria bacterium]